MLPLLLASALLLAAPRAGSAQDIGPALDMTLMTGWAGGEAVRYDLEKRAAAAKGGRTATTKTATASSFAYRPSPAVRERTVANLAAKLQASNPAGAQALTAAFGPGKLDYETLYAKIISGTGLRATDAADAMACYLLTGYAIVNNVQDGRTITPALAKGVRGQVAGIMQRNGQLKPDDPVAAARFGEAFKLQTVILTAGWEEAAKKSTLPAYRSSIGSMFKGQYGMDFSQLKLTPQGFARK
ncbi:hypothetical protein EJV47_12460 [Hymenobacter gummosus]|uniref:DUF4919 domain-containing protein n=2 Tax=Hymenobacter gummosus TaxID=1776032 RepID=A0A431U2T1_9BACT|nr:hypothetical protein EJV47_12460 [Hymenobacter gummosus]